MAVIVQSKAGRMERVAKDDREAVNVDRGVMASMRLKPANLQPTCERSRQPPYSGDATAGMPNNNSSRVGFRPIGLASRWTTPVQISFDQ